jgi:hypothetical protein
MLGRMCVTKQEKQFSVVLERVAVIGPYKPEPRLCEAHRRLVELKIRITRDLTDLLNRSGNVEYRIRGRSRAPGRGIPFAPGQSTLRETGAGEQEGEK